MFVGIAPAEDLLHAPRHQARLPSVDLTFAPVPLGSFGPVSAYGKYMHLKNVTCSLVAACCMTATGCAGITGFPARTYSTADQLAALAKYKPADVLVAFDAADNTARGGLTKEGWRNEVLEARIQDMNLHFQDFEK